MNYQDYSEKYAQLLVNNCLVNNGQKKLVIVVENDEILPFAETCLKFAKTSGFSDVEIYSKQIQLTREYLLNTSLDDIKMNPLFDRSPLEKAAKEEANFLFLDAYQENIWQGIENEKISKMQKIIIPQLDVYFENTANLKSPWCCASFPTKEWAKKVYPNLSEKKAYDLLFLNIMKICLCDKVNPLKEWKNVHRKYQLISEKLNALEISKLHYRNSIGTDLKITLPKNHLWLGANDKDYYGNSFMPNMPGYELFTSPIYTETEGKVHSTLPLYYDKKGYIIKPFSLEFKHGKVSKINTQDENDYHILEEITNQDENSMYLGECAIVENDTPVNQTNTIYYNLLYDENASSHLALGTAYPDSLKDGLQMTDEELLNSGLNISNTHVDFMIGTPDLTIEATTKKGKQLIFKNGKFTL